MKKSQDAVDELVSQLKERAKELNCLYQVEELFNQPEASIAAICEGIVKVIPPGWQYPEKCVARIVYKDSFFQSKGFVETPWVQTAEIAVQDVVVGTISVYYTEEMPREDDGPFLKEETRLINSIAERLARHLLHQRLKQVFEDQQQPRTQRQEWDVVLRLLRRTDPKLLLRISRKMANYLCWSGSDQARRVLEELSPAYRETEAEIFKEVNRPHQTTAVQDFVKVSEEVFRIAIDYLGEDETLTMIQKWIREDKSAFLVNILENEGSTHVEIMDALGRYVHLDPGSTELTESREIGFRVSLIRRLLTSQPEYINIAKDYVEVKDFYNLLHHVIFPSNSHGRLGGKAAGLYLAQQILAKSPHHRELFDDIRIPRTHYITSDGILSFLHYNELEDVVAQKYKEIGQVRQEYPFVVQVFKNGKFPPEIVKGLSLALDEFGNHPLIVRSSSLLEDRMGTAFAGKYKSLFIANQGSKQKRLAALIDAIAEVYASTFGPDPIQYRAERGLLDYHEEMGIMIQEVVGSRLGEYFLPAYAGVAFSNNEFRWSPRIQPGDGLVRLVPGLGTRAVDRLTDDYPILISPGQPGLHANVSLDEIVRYSPKKIDVINLKSNSFETVDLRELLEQHGSEYPQLHRLVSVLEHGHLTWPMAMRMDPSNDELVFTFDGLATRTPFLKRIDAILKTLSTELGTPVDIEFVSDGEHFYLLQCRPQSHGPECAPARIPHNIPAERVVFTARRYVSNGVVADLTHIVYVDPRKYSALESQAELIEVGRAVGKLNKTLPKRQFILMGPGRWGSRGDIKLGVSVTYSDINNSAVLVEIAQKKGNYLPELSFGTHFFQDLVEASIRYLPLYPDEPEVIFNEEFLTSSQNILPDLLPEFAHLAGTVRVIDVQQSAPGLTLQVLMNAESEEAVGMLAEPHTFSAREIPARGVARASAQDDHWRWREHMAEEIAAQLDPQRFGVRALYVFGSTKNATAGPESDLDLLVHFEGDDEQRNDLELWLKGWSEALAAMNYLRTGKRSEGLLDVHMVTDEDIRNHTSFAVKIGAVTDAARPLRLNRP